MNNEEISLFPNVQWLVEIGGGGNTVEKSRKLHFLSKRTENAYSSIFFKSCQHFLMKIFARAKNNGALPLSTFRIFKPSWYTIKLKES